MNFLLGLLVGSLLVYLLAYTDFVLSRKLKERIAAVNAHGERFYHYKPLSAAKVAGLSLLYWGIPSFLISPALYLEYRLGFTLLTWAGLTAGLDFYLRWRTSRQTARQALPLLVAAAIAAGLLLGPLLAALSRLLIG